MHALGSLQVFLTQSFCCLSTWLGRKYSLGKGSFFIICLSPATLLLFNNQQLVHFQRASTHHRQSSSPRCCFFFCKDSLWFLCCTALQLGGRHAVSVWKLASHIACSSAVSPEHRAASRAETSWCLTALQRQPRGHKTWLKLTVLANCFIF